MQMAVAPRLLSVLAVVLVLFGPVNANPVPVSTIILFYLT